MGLGAPKMPYFMPASAQRLRFDPGTLIYEDTRYAMLA